MLKTRKSLIKPRSISFVNHKGLCYYCKQPMWTKNILEFSLKHKITLGQARFFKCTGEHLVAYKDGGTSMSENIVAACYFCNSRRHKFGRKDIHSAEYKILAQKRLSYGRWDGLNLV